MAKRQQKKKILRVPIFHRRVIGFACLDTLTKHCEKHYYVPIDKNESWRGMTSDTWGYASDLECKDGSGHDMILWLNHEAMKGSKLIDRYSTLSHEAYHLACYTIRSIGDKPGDHTEETTAYLKDFYEAEFECLLP